MIKVVVLGDQGVGKSTLIAKHCPPVCVPDASTCTIGNKTFALIDSKGADRFRTLTNTFYRAARGTILIYDVTEKESFEHVPMWMSEVRLHTHKMMPVVLVANKCDLITKAKRVVTKEQGQALALAMEVPYIETDATRGLTEALEALVEKMPAVARTASSSLITKGLRPGSTFKIGSLKKKRKKKGVSLLKCFRFTKRSS